MRPNKVNVIRMFLQSGEYIPDPNHMIEFEECLQSFADRNGFDIRGYGRSIKENDFESSARYTVKCFEENPDLWSLYQRTLAHQNGGSYNGGSYNGGYNNGGYNNGRYQYGNSRGTSSYNPFTALLGSLGLGNLASGNKRGGGGKKNSGGGGIPAIVWVFIAVVALVVFYKLVGPAVYSLIMDGGLARIIIIVGAVFFSWKILTSKNMGWPIYIKAVVLFVIWLVILKY